MREDLNQFETRKQEHINLALLNEVQAYALSGLENWDLEHEALPDFNFEDISCETTFIDKKMKTPFFISSMTAGHKSGEELNLRLAECAQRRGWAMGVGSQRREILDPKAQEEWKKIRKRAPHAVLMGNIGVTQLGELSLDQVKSMTDGLEASALFIHLNPLQEVLQKEGTPHFKGSLESIEKYVSGLSVPVIIKEVGCGISQKTAKRLMDVGVRYIDVAGLGGTHWGRLEGLRSKNKSILTDDLSYQASLTYSNWGIPLVKSLLEIKKLKDCCHILASGGVRSGLDAAKLIAMGACLIGYAQPLLVAALKGEQELENKMKQLEFELKIAMFVTGSQTLSDLEKAPIYSKKTCYQKKGLV